MNYSQVLSRKREFILKLLLNAAKTRIKSQTSLLASESKLVQTFSKPDGQSVGRGRKSSRPSVSSTSFLRIQLKEREKAVSTSKPTCWRLFSSGKLNKSHSGLKGKLRTDVCLACRSPGLIPSSTTKQE